MREWTPYLTALLSGLVIPLIIFVTRYIKNAITEQAKIAGDAAGLIALEAAKQATIKGAQSEANLTTLLERNNEGVKSALSRLDEMNGKVAAVMSQQAYDHDRIVWLLGKSGEPIIKEASQMP